MLCNRSPREGLDSQSRVALRERWQAVVGIQLWSQALVTKRSQIEAVEINYLRRVAHCCHLGVLSEGFRVHPQLERSQLRVFEDLTRI